MSSSNEINRKNNIAWNIPRISDIDFLINCIKKCYKNNLIVWKWDYLNYCKPHLLSKDLFDKLIKEQLVSQDEYDSIQFHIGKTTIKPMIKFLELKNKSKNSEQILQEEKILNTIDEINYLSSEYINKIQKLEPILNDNISKYVELYK